MDEDRIRTPESPTVEAPQLKGTCPSCFGIGRVNRSSPNCVGDICHKCLGEGYIMATLTGQQLSHLADDAPWWQCKLCGRKSWSERERGNPCDMLQPDGSRCCGILSNIPTSEAPRYHLTCLRCHCRIESSTAAASGYCVRCYPLRFSV